MSSAPGVVASARAGFNSGVSRDVEWRIKQLRALYKMIEEQEDTFVKALYSDLRKPKHESMMMELIVCKNDALHAIKNLHQWSKPTYVSKNMLQMLDTMYLQKEPLGVVLILGAWNYPVQLVFLPLIAAIAAGNCVVIKPSEVSVNTAKAITHLLPRYLDKECFQVYNGGIAETTALLEERFDHIFYTGNSMVGKIIMTAAAKYVTPVTLEMGGKSPAYVDSDIHADIVARRLVWGKLCNSGQTCIAPDYVLCHRDSKDKLLKHIQSALHEMVGVNPLESPDYARIVSDKHFIRLSKVIEAMPKEKLVIGGEVEASSRFIAPTIYKDVRLDEPAMQEELFGPILPVVTVSGPEEAIEIINGFEKPLAMYIFSNTNKVVNQVLDNTSCGGVCVNDTLLQCASHNLPFGGVGTSGHGRYHGKYGFDLLSHEKAVCWRKQNMESLLSSRYMPFSESKLGVIRKLTEEKESGYCTVM